MENISIPGWAAGLIAIITGVGGWLLNFNKQNRADDRDDKAQDYKQKNDENLAALNVYKDIVNVLQTDRENQNLELRQLNQRHDECIATSARLEAEVRFLREENIKLKTEIELIKKELFEIRHQSK